MKAYIYRNEKGIEPFGEKPRDCLIGGKPLRILQEEVFLSLGVEITKDYLTEDSDEIIAFGDDLYFTKELVEADMFSVLAISFCQYLLFKRIAISFLSLLERCENFFVFFHLFTLYQFGFKCEC